MLNNELENLSTDELYRRGLQSIEMIRKNLGQTRGNKSEERDNEERQ